MEAVAGSARKGDARRFASAGIRGRSRSIRSGNDSDVRAQSVSAALFALFARFDRREPGAGGAR